MPAKSTAPRSISVIASEIFRVWKPVHPFAKPYAQAMLQVDQLSDRFFMEDGRTQVAYFLSNATMWRGDDARRIKAELKSMLKGGK